MKVVVTNDGRSGELITRKQSRRMIAFRLIEASQHVRRGALVDQLPESTMVG